MNKIDPCDTMRNNLIAAAVGLQECTKTAANVVPLPDGRVIAIGTPVQVRKMLEVAPASAQNAPHKAVPAEILGMADCMHMVRAELIEAGIIEKTVAPMFIANAVVKKLQEVAQNAEAIRNQALEEAAEICENNITHCCHTAEHCVEDIRALQSGTATTKTGEAK